MAKTIGFDIVSKQGLLHLKNQNSNSLIDFRKDPNLYKSLLDANRLDIRLYEYAIHIAESRMVTMNTKSSIIDVKSITQKESDKKRDEPFCKQEAVKKEKKRKGGQ